MTICDVTGSLCSSSNSTLTRKYSATAYRASSGQGKNQSILVFETNPGKFLHLILRVSPAGDIARIICN